MFQSTLNLISQCYILCPRVVFSFQFAKVFIIVVQLNSILAVFKKYIHFALNQCNFYDIITYMYDRHTIYTLSPS